MVRIVGEQHLDGAGQLLALVDGDELTARRTASASALASRYLSRPDASRLTMVGTGVLALHLIAAHVTQRPIEEVVIWGRNPSKAEALVEKVEGHKLSVRAVSDLEAAVNGADIISCATLAVDPLIKGDWLKPGQHLDLVGAFTPEMREVDDTAIARTEIYIDTDDAKTTAELKEDDMKIHDALFNDKSITAKNLMWKDYQLHQALNMLKGLKKAQQRKLIERQHTHRM